MPTLAVDAGRGARLEVHAAFAPLAEEWAALAARAGAAPFARPGWIERWWDAFARGELVLLALRDGRGLRAVLPLELRGGILRATANEHTPLFELTAAGHDDAVRLLRAAMRQGARRLELRELDAEGTTARALAEAAAAERLQLRVRELRRAPWVAIAAADPEAYPASLSGRKRRDLARRRRQLAALGELRAEWPDGRERLDELLAEGLALEGSGWKDEAGTAIASSPTAARFYAAVARWAAAEGILGLGFLRLDGRALAFQLSFWDERSSWMLKGGFDQRFRRHSPGVLMLQELVARTYELGLPRAELLGDEEPYKLHFTRRARRIVRAQAFAPTLPGRLDRLGQQYARPLVKKLIASTRA